MKFTDDFFCAEKANCSCPYCARMDELRVQGLQAASRCADTLQEVGGVVLRSAGDGFKKAQTGLGQVKNQVITEEVETQLRKAVGAAAITVGMTFLGVAALRLYLRSFDKQKGR